MYTLKLEDFEYKINSNNLVLKKLINKKEKDIKLLDKYTINGKDYVVNRIGDYSFYNMKIRNIELPDTIEIIGKQAFSLSSIENFNCPPKITKISEGCFNNCKNLKNIGFHDGIEKIEAEAFYYSCIENFIVPPLVTEIPKYCFRNCKNLSKIIFNNVKK